MKSIGIKQSGGLHKIVDRPLKNIVLFFMSISITFYAAKYTIYSPIYVIYLLLLPFAIFLLLNLRNIYVPIDVKVISLLFLYITTTKIMYILTGEFINLFISLYSYLFVRVLKNRFNNKEELFNILKSLINVSIFVLTIDSILRLTNPNPPEEVINYVSNNPNAWFYIYKFSTNLFADSNTVALVVLVLYFLCIEIKPYTKERLMFQKLFLLFLLIFTFSRSAYVSFFVTIFLYWVKKSKYLFKYVIFFIFVCFIVFLFDTIKTDDSLQSKLYIIEVFTSEYKNLNIFEMIFGIGLGNGKDFLGIHTHIHFLTYLLETGFIGLFLFLIFIIYYLYKYKSLVMISLLIAGLSYFPYLGMPFIFLPLAILANMKDKERNYYDK